MSETPNALLDGSRGRRLCLEYAMAVDSGIREVAFWLGHEMDGDVSVLLSTGDRGHAPETPTYVPADLVARLRGLDQEHVNEAAVAEALRAAVDLVRYWQEPDGMDMVAALPEVTTALGEVAGTIMSSRTATGWSAPRGAEQWTVDWQVHTDASPLPSRTSDLLADWDETQRSEERRADRERPRDPHANWSGTWWSVPQRILMTRGSVQGALTLVEDSLGWEAAEVIPVRGAGRELEIRSAQDWAELCGTYPFEVTASRRHDWFRVTGRDGRWLIPDWSRVAQEWDAVHLSTFAYLRAAATLIEIDSEYASVVAGWPPDATLWLTDGTRKWEGPRQHWVRPPRDHKWFRES